MKTKYQKPYMDVVVFQRAPHTLTLDSPEFSDGDDVGYGGDGWTET